MVKDLASQSYWDSTYKKSHELRPVSICGSKNLCAKQIYGKKKEPLGTAESILELGGGGSEWLAFLALRHPEKRFASIDYSREGSDRLRSFLNKSAINNVDVIVGDFFSESVCTGRFDFVYSHGVVEHFADLAEVLRAHSRFLANQGKMLTIIPNMAGLLGRLTRLLDKEIYEIHIPHDLESLERGHTEAGLRVIESGYLCSNNFGVLSSCVDKKWGMKWSVYASLVLLSRGVWFCEKKFLNLPATKLFSPYIYVLSEQDV